MSARTAGVCSQGCTASAGLPQPPDQPNGTVACRDFPGITEQPRRFIDLIALHVRYVISEDRTFVSVAGSEQDLPADLVLLAMGFVGPEKGKLLKGLWSSTTPPATSPATGVS